MALNDTRVLLLVGGVGGAKLALGLAHLLPPENLTILVNTGDDFWHYGLRICPDMDTLLYTLSGRVDANQGWGLKGDTTQVLDSLRVYGEEPWFRLGDQDLATHLLRTQWLRERIRLTEIVQRLADKMRIAPHVLPMSDDEIATMIDTVEYGELGFQTYFVKHRWQPRLRGIRCMGAEEARPTPEVLAAIDSADVIIIGPSNPWLSIAPILSVPGLRDALVARDVPRVAVTPIVQGQAIKGPAAKLMAELGYDVSAEAVAAYYGELLTGFVYDMRDGNMPETINFQTVAFDTMMMVDEDKVRLAQEVLSWTMKGYSV